MSDQLEQNLKMTAKQLEMLKGAGFTRKMPYSFSFFATKNGLELTDWHDDESEQMFDTFQDELEEIASGMVPRDAATGWFTVDVDDESFSTDIHTVHAH